MKSNLYNAIRLAAGILTVLAMIFQQYLPPKRLHIFPNTGMIHAIYGHEETPGKSPAVWVDEAEEKWHCSFGEQQDFYCGYTLVLAEHLSEIDHALDLSSYDGLNIRLRYEGPAQRIRLFLRNYDEAYVQGENWDSTKFMSINTLTSDLRQEAHFKLSEFSVADWWILMRDVKREHAAPEFDAIVSFGIDLVTPGEHTIQVEKVEVVGDWIPDEQFYLAIICFWMALIIWEGANRFYQMYTHSRNANEVISDLVTSYQRLEVQKKEFEARSTTDVLTGVMNRAGISQFVQKLFGSDYDKEHIGVMLFDIDHFKRINDVHGHDVGDRIIKEVAQIIANNTRQSDVFGRWGGEEFILVCPQTTPQSLQGLAEKLCQLVRQHTFLSEDAVEVTVSVGVTTVCAYEHFDAVFKRADKALYQAKHNGRNCVVFLTS